MFFTRIQELWYPEKKGGRNAATSVAPVFTKEHPASAEL